MGSGRGQDRGSIAVSVAAALLVHGALAGGLGAAEHFGWTKHQKKAEAVEMEIVAKPPPPPPEVAKVEPPPPPPPPKLEAPPPPKVAARARVAPRTPAKVTPPPAEAAPPPPAPGPPVEEAAGPEIKLDIPASAQGSVAAPQGTSPTGVPGGKRGGTGTGTGGGGPADSTGTGPRVVSAASLKSQPAVDGDFDRVQLGKDYPPDAKRLGIEGQVQVRLLVDDSGRVAQTKLVKGLGYGLDDRAVTLARKIRFKPARDTNDQPVATWITWSFNFELPE